jgi:hypothetical protein
MWVVGLSHEIKKFIHTTGADRHKRLFLLFLLLFEDLLYHLIEDWYLILNDIPDHCCPVEIT